MKTLVVFDFDWTMIDENSDTVFIQHLVPGLDLSVERKKFDCWTYFMDDMMRRAHELGKLQLDIETSMKSISMHAGMIKALNAIKSNSGTTRILSDANTEFIRVILDHYQMAGHVEQIVTNPAVYDETGRMRVTPCHTHACTTCAVNLCKGDYLSKWLLEQYDTVVYLGDSTNDFCPATKLRPNDYVLVRQGMSLEKAVAKDRDQIKAQVEYWKDGDDVHRFFEKLYSVKTENAAGTSDAV